MLLVPLWGERIPPGLRGGSPGETSERLCARTFFTPRAPASWGRECGGPWRIAGACSLSPGESPGRAPTSGFFCAPAGLAAAGVQRAVPHAPVISSQSPRTAKPEQPVDSTVGEARRRLPGAPAGCLVPAWTQRAGVCGLKPVWGTRPHTQLKRCLSRCWTRRAPAKTSPVPSDGVFCQPRLRTKPPSHLQELDSLHQGWLNRTLMNEQLFKCNWCCTTISWITSILFPLEMI